MALWAGAVRRRWINNEDDEVDLDGLTNTRLTLSLLRDNSNPFSGTEKAFRGRYRLSKDLAISLVADLRPIIDDGPLRANKIAPEIKVLAALHFFGHESNQKSASGDSNLGLSQPSFSRCLQSVVSALNEPHIITKWVVFPVAQKRRQLIISHFEQFQLPGVIGFVDGTHISIKKPKDHEEVFVNRKFVHSLNVQMACDSNLIIFSVLARYPGSCHDAFIWRNSALRQQTYRLNDEECWLLGDSGYPSETRLLTPILYAEAGSREERYTKLHIRARNCIERCFGVLKGRFRCLLKKRVLEYTPAKAALIVNSCVVLHNMCRHAQVPLPMEAGGDDDIDEDDAPLQLDAPDSDHHCAVAVRNAIIARL